jgi:hypothetical protein
MKACGGSGGVVPRSSYLGTNWAWVVCLPFLSFYCQDNNRITHWIGGWVRLGVDVVPTGDQAAIPRSPIPQPVAIPTELRSLPTPTARGRSIEVSPQS